MAAHAGDRESPCSHGCGERGSRDWQHVECSRTHSSCNRSRLRWPRLYATSSQPSWQQASAQRPVNGRHILVAVHGVVRMATHGLQVTGFATSMNPRDRRWTVPTRAAPPQPPHAVEHTHTHTHERMYAHTRWHSFTFAPTTEPTSPQNRWNHSTSKDEDIIEGCCTVQRRTSASKNCSTKQRLLSSPRSCHVITPGIDVA